VIFDGFFCPRRLGFGNENAWRQECGFRMRGRDFGRTIDAGVEFFKKACFLSQVCFFG
jgi:hypothetical protein